MDGGNSFYKDTAVRCSECASTVSCIWGSVYRAVKKERFMGRALWPAEALRPGSA